MGEQDMPDTVGRRWDLADLIREAGCCLQREDAAFRRDLVQNAACPGQSGGILRLANERYFQFLLARSYAAVLPYVVRVEDARRDMTFSDLGRAESDPRAVVIEMKCWFSATGNSELAGIRRDLFGNLADDVAGTGPNAFLAQRGYLFIFSANPRGQMKANLEWLAGKLGIDPTHWEAFSFETENVNGQAVEFWLAGYDVADAVPDGGVSGDASLGVDGTGEG